MKNEVVFGNATTANTISSWRRASVARRFAIQSTPILAILFLLGIDKKAHAGGGFFSEPRTPVLQAAETIIFGVQQIEHNNSNNNGGSSGNNNSIAGINVTMQIRILYEGPPSEFSWVIPLPAKPTVGIGSEILFHALEEAAAPVFNLRILEESDSCARTVLETERNLCSTPNNSPAQVEAATPVMSNSPSDTSSSVEQQPTILEQGSLAPYDFVIIESSKENPDSAYDWLESNVSHIILEFSEGFETGVVDVLIFTNVIITFSSTGL
jgi:hypothetical protein